ncbi:MAG: hypothetical protein WDW36_006403 [Sanguina aurantia]
MGTVWDRLFKFPTEKKAAPVAQDREGRSRYATFTDCVEEYKNHVVYANYRCNAKYQLFKQHVEEVKQKMEQEKIDMRAAEAVAAAQAAKKSRGWWSRGAG